MILILFRALTFCLNFCLDSISFWYKNSTYCEPTATFAMILVGTWGFALADKLLHGKSSFDLEYIKPCTFLKNYS